MDPAAAAVLQDPDSHTPHHQVSAGHASEASLDKQVDHQKEQNSSRKRSVEKADHKKEEARRKKTKMLRVSDAVYEQLSQISVVLREDRRAVVEKLITNCFKNLEVRQQVHKSVKLAVKVSCMLLGVTDHTHRFCRATKHSVHPCLSIMGALGSPLTLKTSGDLTRYASDQHMVV